MYDTVDLVNYSVKMADTQLSVWMHNATALLLSFCVKAGMQPIRVILVN